MLLFHLYPISQLGYRIRKILIHYSLSVLCISVRESDLYIQQTIRLINATFEFNTLILQEGIS